MSSTLVPPAYAEMIAACLFRDGDSAQDLLRVAAELEMAAKFCPRAAFAKRWLAAAARLRAVAAAETEARSPMAACAHAAAVRPNALSIGRWGQRPFAIYRDIASPLATSETLDIAESEAWDAAKEWPGRCITLVQVIATVRHPLNYPTEGRAP